MSPTTGAARRGGPSPQQYGAGPVHVVRDWALPSSWVASRDLGTLGQEPGFFEDTLGVLMEPGGAVSVAVHHGPLPEDVAAAAQRRARHRPPPTLLIERRVLRCPPQEARRRWREAAGARAVTGGDTWMPSPRDVTMARVGVHDVAMVRTRPWLAAGPGVRVAAVLVMDGVRDALVLTMTWDDEYGMEALEALMVRTVGQLELQVEPAPEAAAEIAARSPATGRAAVRIPRHWNGVSAPGREVPAPLEALAGGLTAGVRGVFREGFFLPCLLVWLLGIVVLAAQALAAGTPAAAGVVLGVLVIACALPYVLAWRSWTTLHGLVTDAADRTVRLPVHRIRPTGLWYYLATAVILAVALFGNLIAGFDGALPVRNGVALGVWLGGHLILVVLEHLRPSAPRWRRWWQGRAIARLGA